MGWDESTADGRGGGFTAVSSTTYSISSPIPEAFPNCTVGRQVVLHQGMNSLTHSLNRPMNLCPHTNFNKRSEYS